MVAAESFLAAQHRVLVDGFIEVVVSAVPAERSWAIPTLMECPLNCSPRPAAVAAAFTLR